MAVIPKWTAALINGDPVYIYGDGETTVISVISIMPSKLTVAANTSTDAVNQVYNVAVGKDFLNDLTSS